MPLFKRKKEKIKPETVSSKTSTVVSKKTKRPLLTSVIKGPRLTEKSSMMTGNNKYVFVAEPGANKNKIRNEIEAKFGVEVVNVNTTRLPSKERRRGVIIGHKPGIKKAIVTLKEGQKIEIQ